MDSWKRWLNHSLPWSCFFAIVSYFFYSEFVRFQAFSEICRWKKKYKAWPAVSSRQSLAVIKNINLLQLFRGAFVSKYNIRFFFICFAFSSQNDLFFFWSAPSKNWKQRRGKNEWFHICQHIHYTLCHFTLLCSKIFVFSNDCMFPVSTCESIFTYKSSPHDHLRAKAHRQHAFLWTLESNLAMRFWSYWKQDKWLINGIMHLSLTATVDCTGSWVLLTWNCEFRGCSWSPVNCARQNGTQCNSVLSGQTRGLAHGSNIAGQHCKESSRFVCVQWSV